MYYSINFFNYDDVWSIVSWSFSTPGRYWRDLGGGGLYIYINIEGNQGAFEQAAIEEILLEYSSA